ncbi:MAG: FAD-dependent oxidoreductase [Planctomycetota bacterium]
MSQVSVVGGGIIGLTSALALQDAGFDVTLLADRPGLESVSGVAGALWHPFRCAPPALVSRQAALTRAWYNQLAQEHPSAGVDILDLYELRDTEETPWWSADTPDLRPMHSGFPGGDALIAWHVKAPRAEPGLLIPWLESLLIRPIVRRKVLSFQSVPGDLVVNCTGLGARSLLHDPDLQAIFGHVVVVEPGDIDPGVSISRSWPDDSVFYSIPRRSEVVLGGCVEPCSDDRPLIPSPATRDAILLRARQAGLRPGRVIREACGLRPFRTSIRVQREGRVIHNYGHGGAGYTLCWGSALDVVRLALSHATDPGDTPALVT